MNTAQRLTLRLAASGLILGLVGCEAHTDLYTALAENEANEVMAQLQERHIPVDKHTSKAGVAISVAQSDVATAVQVLDAAGLPHHARLSLGEVFKKDGVISSPLEEHARYLYALSQELEETLSHIDGVVVARVHVVLPERVAPGEPVLPASAAVFIKHTSGLDPDSVRARIQQMVAASLPGMTASGSLDGRKFSIVFVPASEVQRAGRLVPWGPFMVQQHDTGLWTRVLLGGIALLLVGVVGLCLGLRSDWRQRLGALVRGRSSPPKEVTHASEP